MQKRTGAGVQKRKKKTKKNEREQKKKKKNTRFRRDSDVRTIVALTRGRRRVDEFVKLRRKSYLHRTCFDFEGWKKIVLSVESGTQCSLRKKGGRKKKETEPKEGQSTKTSEYPKRRISKNHPWETARWNSSWNGPRSRVTVPEVREVKSFSDDRVSSYLITCFVRLFYQPTLCERGWWWACETTRRRKKKQKEKKQSVTRIVKRNENWESQWKRKKENHFHKKNRNASENELVEKKKKKKTERKKSIENERKRKIVTEQSEEYNWVNESNEN